MGFLVNFQGVPIWEGFAALVAVQRSLTSVQLIHVQPQICLPSTGDWAQFTLIDGLVSGVNLHVLF